MSDTGIRQSCTRYRTGTGLPTFGTRQSVFGRLRALGCKSGIYDFVYIFFSPQNKPLVLLSLFWLDLPNI